MKCMRALSSISTRNHRNVRWRKPFFLHRAKYSMHLKRENMQFNIDRRDAVFPGNPCHEKRHYGKTDGLTSIRIKNRAGKFERLRIGIQELVFLVRTDEHALSERQFMGHSLRVQYGAPA